MKNWIAVICMYSLILPSLSSQNNAGIVSVGILPVTSIPSYGESYVDFIRDQISNCFASKSRFTVVDRTQLELITKEKNLQMREDFIDGVIVEQGKSIGAQFLVNCNISEISYQNVNTPIVIFVHPYSSTRLDVKIEFVINIQLIDVETSSIRSSKRVAHEQLCKGTETRRPEIEPCVYASIETIGNSIKKWVNEVFPVEMRVIKVEESDKKGRPKTVLVTGGEDMDMTSRSGGSELEVIEVEILLVDGKEYPRTLVIGKVAVDEVQGPVSICQIKTGHDAILEKMNAGKTLFLRIKEY